MLFSLVTQAAQGKKSALTQLNNALASGSPTMALVEDAVQNAGTDEQRATLLDQRTDFPWSLHMRMDLQEFRTVLTDDVTFENGIRGVLSSAGFGCDHQRALLTGATSAAKAVSVFL